MPLPVVSSQPKIRRSRSTRWRAGVLVAVHLLIAAHISHWLVAGRTVTPVEPSEAAALARSGVVNAGLVFFAVTILLTAVFGRLFCGWACHLVALQDLSRALLARFGRRPKPLRSRVLVWVPALAFLYLFVWPLAYRLVAGPALASVGFELTTAEFWATFPGWAIAALTFGVCGFASVYFLGAKGFCTYACPYGAIFGVADKLAPWRIRVSDACQGCGHCTAVCTSNVRVHEEVREYGMVVDPGCMKCLDCVSVCPNEALSYRRGPLPWSVERPAAPARRPALTRIEEGVLAVAFAAAFITFRGLYGMVPFLMALGVAGALAYGVLLVFQLATRPNLALKGHRLRLRGRIQRAGWVLVAAMTVVGAFWTHSAVLRYHAFAGDRGFRQLTEMRRQALDLNRPAPTIDPGRRESLRRTLEHLERVRTLGLVATAGNAAKMAWLHDLTGSPERAAALAGEAIERDEASSEMYRLLGRDAWERGDVEAATEAYEAAVAADPHVVDAHLSLGIVHARTGRLAAAEDAFARGLRQVPRSSELAYNLGLVRALAGDVDGAVAGFGRALELDPRNRAARENLAGVLASLGRFEESAEHYRVALEAAPADAETRLLLARVLLALGRLDEAETELRQASTLDPGLREATMLLEQVVRSRNTSRGSS